MGKPEVSKLSVESLFKDNLKPDPAINFKFAPDDSCITFLARNTTKPNELSIWRFDLARHTTEEWICAPIKSNATSKSKFERDEQERKRQFSSGITDYHWHPSGSALIIPINGSVFSVDITNPDQHEWKLLSQESGISAVKLSPLGLFFSFVKENNLHFQIQD